MSRDVEVTIRRHFEANDSLQTPIGRTEIVEKVSTDGRSVPVPTRRRGYGVRVAVGAAVATLILVGGLSMMTRLQESPVADSVIPSTLVTPSVVVPPTVATPPTTNTPATTIAPLSTQTFPVWTGVQGPDGATSEGSLTTDDNGYIYCGGSFIATSPNGINWERTGLSRQANQLGPCIAWGGVVVTTRGGGASAGEGQQIVANPSFVEVSQPGGDASSFRIDGDITSTAIGGTGILIATVDNRLDPMIIAGLTVEEEEKVAGTSDEDGILTIVFTDGTVRSVNVDELGIDSEDIYKTSWWFSKDGIDWALQPNESRLDPLQVVGTESGFYAIDGSTIWFTTSGVSWEEIGTMEGEGRLTRSGGKAIVISPEWLYILSPNGLTEYALDDLPALTIPVVGDEDRILAIQHWNGEESELKLLGSIPGQPFEIEDIPPDMESANEFGFFSPSYTVFGSRYLLLLFEDNFAPTFWTKDFPPN